MEKVTLTTAEFLNAEESLFDALNWGLDEGATEGEVAGISRDILGVWADRDDITDAVRNVGNISDACWDCVAHEIMDQLFTADRDQYAVIQARLNDLWDNNAFGDLDDFDRDDIEGDAEKLLTHWQSMGWARGVDADDVAEYLRAKLAE